MKGEFTTIIDKHGEWYVGYIEEISGVNTQGKTIEEVEEDLKEALELTLLSYAYSYEFQSVSQL